MDSGFKKHTCCDECITTMIKRRFVYEISDRNQNKRNVNKQSCRSLCWLKNKRSGFKPHKTQIFNSIPPHQILPSSVTQPKTIFRSEKFRNIQHGHESFFKTNILFVGFLFLYSKNLSNLFTTTILSTSCNITESWKKSLSLAAPPTPVNPWILKFKILLPENECRKP